jgi:hypothetical protein
MKPSSPTLSRRRFLLAAGAGGAATVAAVASKKSPDAQPKKAEAAHGGKGYHVTEHIRKYYNTAKL